MELKDLEKTLKNIEEARSFDELTVVRSVGYWEKMDEGLICYRTRLLPLAQISTSVPPSSFPRDAGAFQVTRQVIPSRRDAIWAAC